jgi:ABC-type nitrate/sulfonate/bicarbonate transport system ATPase subunit
MARCSSRGCLNVDDRGGGSQSASAGTAPLSSHRGQRRASSEVIGSWERTAKTIVFVTHSVEEAVFLADRIVVLHANPGCITATVPVDLPRPRIHTNPEFNMLESQALDLLDESLI